MEWEIDRRRKRSSKKRQSKSSTDHFRTALQARLSRKDRDDDVPESAPTVVTYFLACGNPSASIADRLALPRAYHFFSP